jgi:hypothetical protein
MTSVPLRRHSFFFDDPVFKSTWSDYDQVRNLLFNEEPTSSWQRYEGDFRQQPCLATDLVENNPDFYGDLNRK